MIFNSLTKMAKNMKQFDMSWKNIIILISGFLSNDFF